jgi:hypothetical protein
MLTSLTIQYLLRGDVPYCIDTFAVLGRHDRLFRRRTLELEGLSLLEIIFFPFFPFFCITRNLFQIKRTEVVLYDNNSLYFIQLDNILTLHRACQ